MPSSALVRPVVAPPPRLAEIAVLDRDTGERLPVYWHDGQRWVAGAPGHRYAVSVRNRTAGRILTVVSVDGVNAVSGETAGWDQRGYVLSPWVSYDVLGWRKSSSTVAGFVFTALADSYAARTGRAADVGVIGVALFRERRPQPAQVAPGPDAPIAALPERGEAREWGVAEAPAMKLGTGHGERERSYVSNTEFDRMSDEPNSVIRIRYDSLENLVAMGIVPRPTRPSANPFPGSSQPRYAPDPPG